MKKKALVEETGVIRAETAEDTIEDTAVTETIPMVVVEDMAEEVEDTVEVVTTVVEVADTESIAVTTESTMIVTVDRLEAGEEAGVAKFGPIVTTMTRMTTATMPSRAGVAAMAATRSEATTAEVVAERHTMAATMEVASARDLISDPKQLLKQSHLGRTCS